MRAVSSARPGKRKRAIAHAAAMPKTRFDATAIGATTSVSLIEWSVSVSPHCRPPPQARPPRAGRPTRRPARAMLVAPYRLAQFAMQNLRDVWQSRAAWEHTNLHKERFPRAVVSQ